MSTPQPSPTPATQPHPLLIEAEGCARRMASRSIACIFSVTLLAGLLGGCSKSSQTQAAPTGPALSAEAQLGQEVYLRKANPPCGTCHQLRHAGTRGAIGPDLDVLKPDAEKITTSIRNGIGVMPSQAHLLNDAEINAVAAYIIEVTQAATTP